MTVRTDFEEYKADVACIIPPQRAGRIAVVGRRRRPQRLVPDRPGDLRIARWCRASTSSATRRSRGAMPKSAFSANAQAKVCAARGHRPPGRARARDAEAHQHLLQPRGARLRHLGRGRLPPGGRRAADVEGAGGVSPLDAPAGPARAGGALRRRLVPHHHPAGVRVKRAGLRAGSSRRLHRPRGVVGRRREGASPCGPSPSSATPSRHA